MFNMVLKKDDFENVTVSLIEEPLTVNEPEDAEYILLFGPIAYEYVPLTSLNDIVDIEEDNDWPLVRLTYHNVPEGNPVSVKMILYIEIFDLSTLFPNVFSIANTKQYVPASLALKVLFPDVIFCIV